LKWKLKRWPEFKSNTYEYKYENEYDIIYLFAENSVLSFYTKFGFKQIIEDSYELDTNQINKKEIVIKKLEINDENDCNTILRIIKNKKMQLNINEMDLVKQ
jgi:hypothetical protein